MHLTEKLKTNISIPQLNMALRESTIIEREYYKERRPIVSACDLFRDKRLKSDVLSERTKRNIIFECNLGESVFFDFFYQDAPITQGEYNYLKRNLGFIKSKVRSLNSWMDSLLLGIDKARLMGYIHRYYRSPAKFHAIIDSKDLPVHIVEKTIKNPRKLGASFAFDAIGKNDPGATQMVVKMCLQNQFDCSHLFDLFNAVYSNINIQKNTIGLDFSLYEPTNIVPNFIYIPAAEPDRHFGIRLRYTGYGDKTHLYYHGDDEIPGDD